MNQFASLHCYTSQHLHKTSLHLYTPLRASLHLITAELINIPQTLSLYIFSHNFINLCASLNPFNQVN